MMETEASVSVSAIIKMRVDKHPNRCIIARKRRTIMSIAKVKTKTTFKIDAEVLDQVITWTKTLGLRRDAYLSEMLNSGLSELELVPSNSQHAESFLRKMREVQSEGGRFKKINLSLDADVVAKINKVCRKKRFVRDMYVEQVLMSLVESSDWGPAPLPAAYNLIYSPYDGSPGDGSLFSEVSLGDLTQEDLDKIFASVGLARVAGS